MPNDQIFNMKMEVKLGQLTQFAPNYEKNINKILLEDARGTCIKCVQR
jgi:hypothetical protein